MRKLVHGVGVNDADYKIRRNVGGGRQICNYYTRWVCMLKRCYSKKYQLNKPSYIGCYVCEEWLTFSNFKRWMESQDWQGKDLDKDILLPGNKLYSPGNCVFVDASTNTFVINRESSMPELPVGVHLHAQSNKFKAQCCNPFTGKQEHIGLYSNPECAHIEWKKRKHKFSCKLAELQAD
jgi:hypothetical protein